MTMSASAGTDHSSRASPSDAVSPETPALATTTSWPRSFKAASSCSGKDSPGPTPYPAVRLSPKATTLTGSAAAPAKGASARTAATSWQPIRCAILKFSILGPYARNR
jgi:hypothetical protein